MGHPIKLGDIVLYQIEENGKVPGTMVTVEYPAIVYRIHQNNVIHPPIGLFVFIDPAPRRFAYVNPGNIAGTYKEKEK
jgi:hypothetical protein